MAFDLSLIWALLLAVGVFLYVTMDGFDLGIGILFPAIPLRAERDTMIRSIGPVWDGNETWLVLGGGGLFAAFPLAYATILPALYMPLILMLLALIFRGVAFEMRFRVESEVNRSWWDRAFSIGSYVAAFCQGISVGAWVQGIKVTGRSYAGGWWDWLTPFSLMTGLALVTGYALLGACWIVWKTEGHLQERAAELAKPLSFALLGFIGAVSVAMLVLSDDFRARWLTLPGLIFAAPVPILCVALSLWLSIAISSGRQLLPFLAALGLFLLSYIGLGISTWPWIVPPNISIWDAATAPASQLFLLVGALVMIPIILAYTGYVYWLFRGKVSGEGGYH